MANTLKFGTDGNWAVKEGSALAYNDENGNFKPLPFTFDRAGSATRVNKQGLIEVVSNNEPRIDFLNDSKGALLLEPSRSNLVTYSEDFTDSSWFFDDATLISNSAVSPDGTQNASTLIGNTVNSRHHIAAIVGNASVDGSYTVFAKAKELRYLQITSVNTTQQYVNFDLLNGVFVLGSDFSNAKMEDYGNGWYKCTVVSNNEYNGYYISLVSGLNATWLESWVMPNNTDGLYIWGAQLEQGSYATSYIPTQGSIGTRVAESSVQTPPSGIIGQTEGTVYTELNMSNIGKNFIFSIDDGGASDFIILDTNSIGELDLQVRQSSGSITTIISGNDLIEGINKIAIRYKSGDYSLYLNGVLQGTSTSTLFPSGTISRVSVGANSSYGFLSNSVNDFKLYDTALTNTELQALTKI